MEEEGRSVSRATIINAMNEMVDAGILNYTEKTGKGGYHRIYSPTFRRGGLQTPCGQDDDIEALGYVARRDQRGLNDIYYSWKLGKQKFEIERMGRVGMLRVSIPLLKKHMEEEGKALTTGEAAEVMGLSPSATLGVLDSMEAIGIVQRVRTRKSLYFLKDTYDDERIEAMIMEADERTQSGTVIYRVASHRSKYDPIIDRFLEIEDELVRVDVDGKKPNYITTALKRRIKARELGDRIKSSVVNNCSYLEKI